MKRFAPLLLALLVSTARADIPADLLKKAEGGDAAAQLEVATRYMAGNGVAQDEKISQDWLRRSAEGGNREAAFTLGMLHQDGRFIAKDDVEAAKWFRKAADLGDAWAQYALYEFGDDTMLQKAAEGGHPGAQMKYGQQFFEKKDYQRAYFWLTFPSEGDNFPGEAQELRDRAAEHIKPDDILRLKQEALEWVARDYRELREKAQAGDAAAQLSLALHYQSGNGMLKSPDRMMQWLKKSGEQGNAEAQYMIGAHLVGNGSWNFKEGAPWLEKAAKQGHVFAAYALGNINSSLVGQLKQDETAVKWYRQAAEAGNDGAQEMLGLHYARGLGVNTDHIEAVFWLSLAEAQGRTAAKDPREQSLEYLSPEQRAAVKKRLQAWKPAKK